MPGLLPSTAAAVAARRAGRLSDAVALVDAEAQRVGAEERSAADHLEWGLCYESAGLESTSLGTLMTAYNLATAAGDTQVAFEAAGQLAWLHALPGRGHDAELWLGRTRDLAGSSGVVPSRRAEAIAAAVRAADALRPDLAVELMAARPTGPEDELRLVAIAQSAVFRLGTGSSPGTLLDELRGTEAADPRFFVEYGEDLVLFRYTEALLHLAMDRPDLAAGLLEQVADRGGESFVIGLRALSHLLAGDAEAALREADRAFAYYHQWPRILVPAGLVKALLAAAAGDHAAAGAAFVTVCRIADENAIPSTLLNVAPDELRRLADLTRTEEVPTSIRAMLAGIE